MKFLCKIFGHKVYEIYLNDSFSSIKDSKKKSEPRRDNIIFCLRCNCRWVY